MELSEDLGSGPLDAPLYLIGRDWGADEARERKPFVGQAGWLLTNALRDAGISRDSVRIDNLVPRQPPGNDWARHAPGDIEWGQARLRELLSVHRPRVIVAFGNEVCRFLVGEAWPDAEGVQALRGYLWDTPYGRVLASVHPAAILRDWTPWAALLTLDLRKAKRELAAGPLDDTQVTVCTGLGDIAELQAALHAAPWCAVDIENNEDKTLACVGFAPSAARSWVVPACEDWQRDAIRELCESPTPKVLQNGQYDRFFLERFCDIKLRNQVFDTQLAWHALNPELAGKRTQVGERKARSKRTAKSLRFLASIYLKVAHWKDYGFASEDERYTLCGRDTAYTLAIAERQAAQLDAAKLRPVHDFEIALLEPCIAMSQRGVLVDEPRRQAMLAKLGAEREPLAEKLSDFVVHDVLAAHADVPKLLSETRVCKLCRNGKKKRLTCAVCNGAGKFARRVFNPNSDTQVKLVLYELLRLPKRTKGGKLRSDEQALKSLLVPGLADDARELIVGLLRLSKLATMGTILERIRPGPDGRIRTFYNPAGTETGRFSSAESFLVESTNLQNMPKREVTEGDFDVRACFVPDAGCVFVEADLSGAEAWVTAAASRDVELLAKLRDASFDLHRWTASYILTNAMGMPTTPEQVSPVQRQLIGKTPRHALNYGMQWATFQAEVNQRADRTGRAITAAEAKQICAGYLALHPKLPAWWDAVLLALGRDHALTTCFGRRRTFYGRDQRTSLGETHREAIAYEPQSTVADLANRGLLRWWRQHEGKVGHLLMQVHDSVVVQCERARGPLVASLLKRCLTEEITVQGMRITIPVDVKISQSWATLKEAA